jgi:hypothetical protein
MRGLIQSLRYTLRVLLKSPGFTITAVLILGFGIGANTAVFSVIDGVAWPYRVTGKRRFPEQRRGRDWQSNRSD